MDSSKRETNDKSPFPREEAEVDSQPKLLTALVLIFIMTCNTFATENLKAKPQSERPLFGHRNGIVVVDSACPLQTGDPYLNGAFDEFRIYSGELTLQKIAMDAGVFAHQNRHW